MEKYVLNGWLKASLKLSNKNLFFQDDPPSFQETLQTWKRRVWIIFPWMFDENWKIEKSFSRGRLKAFEDVSGLWKNTLGKVMMRQPVKKKKHWVSFFYFFSQKLYHFSLYQCRQCKENSSTAEIAFDNLRNRKYKGIAMACACKISVDNTPIQRTYAHADPISCMLNNSN